MPDSKLNNDIENVVSSVLLGTFWTILWLLGTDEDPPLPTTLCSKHFICWGLIMQLLFKLLADSGDGRDRSCRQQEILADGKLNSTWTLIDTIWHKLIDT